MKETCTNNNHMPHDYFLIILSTKHKWRELSLFFYLEVTELSRTVTNTEETLFRAWEISNSAANKPKKYNIIIKYQNKLTGRQLKMYLYIFQKKYKIVNQI